MTKHRDMDLEEAFLSLLQELSPRLMEERDLAREFAEQLAGFADDWAAGSPDIEEREQNLISWLQSTVAIGESTLLLVDQEPASRLAWLRRRMGLQGLRKARTTTKDQIETHAEAQGAGSEE